MEKEHIYRGGRNERGVTPEYLDSTRAESVELRATPSDRVVLFFLCLISALPLSLLRPPIYSRFFAVFAYGGRVIVVLHALLDPPFSFPLQQTHLYRSDRRPARLSPFVSFPPKRRRTLLRLMTKSRASVNCHQSVVTGFLE